MAEERSDRFREVETFEDYQVNDRDGEKIGKVDELFVDHDDRPEYIGVEMGLFGLSGETLIPWELCDADEANETITVNSEKSKVKDAPSFDDDQSITSDFERQVHEYYGLQVAEGSEERGAYGDYYSGEGRHEDEDTELDTEGRVGTEAGGRTGAHDTDSGAVASGGGREDEDEVRVQRTEEELRAGTRERQREGGGVNVRKRVRTDREQVTVPKKREEVSVERVPVDEKEGERTAAEAEIGEDEEISVPVTEEEVVVDKKPVAKEEVRIQKDVVEDEEVVEEDVRKEEIEVDEEGGRRDV